MKCKKFRNIKVDVEEGDEETGSREYPIMRPDELEANGRRYKVS